MEPADPALGRELSSHRHSYTERVILALICAPFAFAGLALAPDSPGLGHGLFAGAVAVFVWFAWLQARETLAVHEHGILIAAGRRARGMLWREVAKISPRYSYVEQPDALTKVTLRAHDGRRLAFGMNWARRRELSRLLWPVLQGGVTRLEAPVPKPPAPARVTAGRAAVRRRALLHLAWLGPAALAWTAGLVWLGSRGWSFHGYELAAPLVPVVYFGAELATGVRVRELSARWDELEGWTRGLVGFGVVAVASVVLLGSAFLVGLWLTGDL